MESFTIKSRDGRRSVSAWKDTNMGVSIWRLELTRSTRNRSETKSARAKTKKDATAQAKAWING